MKRYILSLLMLLTTFAVFAASSDSLQSLKAHADTLYAHKQYSDAEKVYEQLLKQYPNNASLLYNIGNCNYRLKNYAKAILAYERVAKINPSDDDNHHNLCLARMLTEDKYYSASDLDVVFSFNSFINSFGADGWAWMSVLALVLLLACIAMIKYGNRSVYKKLAFAGIIGMGVCIVVFNVFAYIQNSKYDDHTHAIVMKTTKLMSTPEDKGKALVTLHGGTKVTISDTTIQNWTEVILPDEQSGWVSTQSLENI